MSNKTINIVTIWKSGYIYLAATLAFLIVHFTNDVISVLLHRLSKSTIWMFTKLNSDAILQFAPAIKSILFLVCIFALCIPVFQDLRRNSHQFKLSNLLRTLAIGLGTVILLSLLVTINGRVEGMGGTYARLSEQPFEQNASKYSTRILMNAIAYFLFLRGNFPYYIFSVGLTIAFISLTYSWVRANSNLAFWQFVSLCTSSFIVYQFEVPGYPDILVFIFFILVMQHGFSSEAKLSFLILALLAHESCVLIGLMLAWRYLPKKNFTAYIIMISTYGLLWFIASRFNVSLIFANHDVAGQSGLQWLIQTPLQELLGVFIAFKMLWLIIIAGSFLAFRNKLFGDAAFIVGCVIAALLMTVLAVDTSRLIGFAFPALLISTSIVSNSAVGKKSRNILSIVFFFNLLIPSFNIGLNLPDIRLTPGLYEHFDYWMGILGKKLSYYHYN